MKQKQSINECIIFRKKFEGKTIVGKHRDRAYDCTTSVIRELHGDLEIVMLKDMDTLWMEGINSEGICITNSTLTVGVDEIERMLVRKSGKKFKDGSKVKHALKFKNIEDTVYSLAHYRGGLAGHTLVTNGEVTYTIESQAGYETKITKKEENLIEPIVRTNHGYDHGRAGYNDGDDFLSSALRKDQMLKNLESIEPDDDISDIIEKIGKTKYGDSSPYNVVRNTENMRTTSQSIMIPQSLMFCLKIINGEFGGIHDYTPEDHKDIIEIQIID